MDALIIFLTAMSIAIATVIFIHLFFKRVSRTVLFTYTWLLKRTLQQIKRRRKLQHILILFLRVGTVSFVTLALLSFFYKPDKLNVPAVVIIDNSASMTRDDPPLIWQAIEWIEENVDNFLYAITCDNIIKDRNQLSTIGIYYGFCALDKQLALIRTLSDTVTIFVISDFQPGYYTGIFKNSIFPIVMEGTLSNAWIDSVWLSNENIIIKWLNTGSQDISIQLKVNDKVKAVKKWRSQDSIQYDTTTIHPENRINTVHISISGDPVYFDNDFYAVLGTRPIKVYLIATDSLLHLVQVIEIDTSFQVVSEPEDADVILSGFINDLPESMRRSLLNSDLPTILFYRPRSQNNNRVWLNRRNSFWKGVLQDYGKAPIPLPISAPCPSETLRGEPLLFTDSCTIASIENQTLHVVYDPENNTLSNHPIYIAMIYKVLLGKKSYELQFFRNDAKTISLISNQQTTLIPIETNFTTGVNHFPPKPGFYHAISNTDTQLIAINLPKAESILTPKVPRTTKTQPLAQESRLLPLIPYLLLSFALILLLIESLVLRKMKYYEENAS